MKNDVLMIELTEAERDTLLRGLRYVRRSVMLETRDPNPIDEAERFSILEDIQNLALRLEATDSLAAGIS